MTDLGSLVLLEINDLKSIDIAEIRMDEAGQMIRLVGDNGVGKSTVMEGIEALFNGGQVPDDLIKRGKKEATITGTFSSGYIAKRRIRKNKKGEQLASIEVVRADGAKMPAPQSILKEVFAGYMAPSQFANAKGVELYNTVVTHLPVDVAALEAAVDSAGKAMSDINTEGRLLGNNTPPPDPRPDIPFFSDENFDNIMEELTESKENYQLNLAKTEELYTIQRQIVTMQERVTRLEEEMKNGKKHRPPGIIEAEMVEMRSDRDKRNAAEQLIGQWERYDEWNEKAKTFKVKAAATKIALDTSKDEMRRRLSQTVAPGGARVDQDRKVFIHDAPWENAAFSERLKTAALLQIESLPEGKLPIMFIEHGEAMNTEKRMEVAGAAIQAGATVFMEIVKEEIDVLTIESETVVPKGWDNPGEAFKKATQKIVLSEDDIKRLSNDTNEPTAIEDKMKKAIEQTAPPTILSEAKFPPTGVPGYPTEEELELF